jgi:hypothetical protein
MVRVSLGWLRGVDLNHRPLGYELVGNCKFNYLAAQMTTHETA